MRLSDLAYGRVQLALTVLLILSTLALAQEAPTRSTLLELKRTRHMGVEEITAWEVWTPEGPTINRKFIVEGPFRNVWIDVMLYQSTRGNAILINNLTVVYLCEAKVAGWYTCRIDIPPKHVKIGANTFEIKAVKDFMLKELKLNIEYVKGGAYVIVSKSLSTNRVPAGSEVNVSVVLTNLGAAPALNVSAWDVKPPGTYLKSGSTAGGFDLLRGGDIYRYQYTIVPEETGDYKSWPGRFEYYDRDGVKYVGGIEATVLTAIPPKPSIRIIKSISRDSMYVGSVAEVKLTIVNNGAENAHNLRVYNYLSENISVDSGNLNATFKLVEAGVTTVYNYNITPTTSGRYSTKAVAYYEDYEGNEYTTYSNHIEINSKNVAVKSRGFSPIELLLIIFAMAFTLLMVYLKLKK